MACWTLRVNCEGSPWALTVNVAKINGACAERLVQLHGFRIVQRVVFRTTNDSDNCGRDSRVASQQVTCRPSAFSRGQNRSAKDLLTIDTGCASGPSFKVKSRPESSLIPTVLK
jgi:hypothetical protein